MFEKTVIRLSYILFYGIGLILFYMLIKVFGLDWKSITFLPVLFLIYAAFVEFWIDRVKRFLSH